jgi:hypothetical protein
MRVRASIVVVEKATSITHFECVFVALVIRHAERMRGIVICGLLWFNSIFLLHLVKGTIFEKNLLNIRCVF